MDGLSWPSIRTFSSTGECSYPNDFLWLMSIANYQAPGLSLFLFNSG